MGSFRKHLDIASEKLNALVTAYRNKQHTVVGDLGTKVVEQLIEADTARVGKHFGSTLKDTNTQKGNSRLRSTPL